MNECKLKHLEFIQNVITRMNQNSFLIKGWSVVIVSALFALAAKDADMRFVYVSYIAVLVFWFLDSFYLSTEKKFRDLYKNVAQKTESNIDFDMNIKPFESSENSLESVLLSKTIFPFYLLLVSLTILIIYFINGVSNG